MDSLDLARLAFRKYGQLRVRTQRDRSSLHVNARLRITGRTKLRDVLVPVLSLLPVPHEIISKTQRHFSGTRSVLTLEWQSLEKTWELLDILGPVGKPSWDAKATALLRWREYHRESVG